MSEHECKIADGKSPAGDVVSFWEVERPGTVGAKGAQDYLVEVRGVDGKRITHSDSLAGLKKAGFAVLEPAPVAPPVQEPEFTPVDVVEMEPGA